MSVPSHPELVGRPIRLQRTAINRWSLHGLGNTTRQNTGVERLTVHWRFGIQCGNHKRYCRRSGQFDCGSSDVSIRHHHCTDIDINYGNAVATIRAKDQRYMGQGKRPEQRSNQPQHGSEDGVQHQALYDG